MLSKRLIACLDVRNGCVVKGVNFEGLRKAGDPAELAKRSNAEGIDAECGYSTRGFERPVLLRSLSVRQRSRRSKDRERPRQP